MTRNIPGNPVMPLHYVVVDGKVSHERFPGIIVYTKMNNRGMKEFRRFCEHHNMAIVVWNAEGEREVIVCERGMSWSEFQSVCGIGAWEVLGTPELLDRLTMNVCVDKWHEPIACSVHMRGSGAGAEKVKAVKTFADPEPTETTETHIAYRQAVEDGRHEDAEALLVKLEQSKKPVK